MESATDITSLPQVVEKMIYDYLGLDEHLSLRRTCKETKAWVESYSNLDNDSRNRTLQAWKNFQYIISELEDDDEWFGMQIEEFLDSKLENVTNFCILNETVEIFHHSTFQKFVESYCPKIRKLKLGKFFDCESEIEWNFFQALTALQELKIEEVLLSLNNVSNSKSSRIPCCLKNLRSLKFKGKIKIMRNAGEIPILKDSWIYNPLKYCPNLEMLKIPVIFTQTRYDSKRQCFSEDNEIYDELTFVKNVIDSLKDNSWSGKLKYLDLKYFSAYNNNELVVGSLLRELIDVWGPKAVKLLHVHSDLCEGVNNGDCILSVIHDATNNEEFIRTDLPNLESLHVTVTNSCTGLMDPDLTMRKSWPKLKSLKLTLESVVGVTRNSGIKKGAPVFEIVRLLLDSEQRPEIQNFELKFGKREKHGDRKCVTYPTLIIAQSITTNFINLIELSLVGWDTTDMEFSQLWEGLPRLETLNIDDCSTASDVAFIGSNPNEPSFLKLKGLKKLEMDFTYMPRVTELLFQQVLSNMEVQHLVLRSRSKLPTNTIQCISSLSEGKIATSLDKITLELWALDQLPKDHYIELRNSFRSVY